jgi:hypothetical protein
MGLLIVYRTVGTRFHFNFASNGKQVTGTLCHRVPGYLFSPLNGTRIGEDVTEVLLRISPKRLHAG